MPLQFSCRQMEFIAKADHRYNLKTGAVRSGKSFVDVAYTIPARLRAVRNETGINAILGVSKETIERNVLLPMREIYGPDLVGNISSRNIAMVCGVPTYCLGAEKITQVSKIQGASIKYCYGDEIAKWSPEVWEMLKSRLDKPYSRLDGACNPEHPGHWLRKFCDKVDDDKDEKKQVVDIYEQKYTIFDNPFLDPQRVDELCAEYSGTVYYKRYILGEWALAEGLIYPMYNDAIAKPPEGNPLQYRISIDYGTRNAFAAMLWAQYGNTWYAVKGYYYSGRDKGVSKTDEEYAADIDKAFADVLDALPPGHKIKTFIDPSAASFIALLQKRGAHRYGVIPADNSVADGIRETATAMQRGAIKISPDLKEWKKEVEGYVWDEKSADDRPIKINDHYMDATRYFVKTMRLAVKPARGAGSGAQE